MTFEVPALAAGFASQFETIGPYVGFGSLIAVVAMAILVFAQGRELQRLREWAGTSPERLTALEKQLETEHRLTAQPQRVAPVPGVPTVGRLAPHPGAQAPPGAAPPVPGAVPGAPGAVPAGTAAAAGVGAAAAGAAAAGTPGAPTPARPIPPPSVGASNAQATRAVPAVAGTPRAATPAGRAATARQREAPEPPKRSIGQIIGVGVVLAIVAVGVLFAIGVIGGGNDSPVADDNRRQLVEQKEKAKAKPYSPGQTSVVVLNASGQSGIAKTGSDLLDNKRFATGAVGNYSEGNVPVFKPTSIIAYRAGRGNKAAALDIARYLKLKPSTVKLMSSDIKLSVDGTPDIVVVLGQDYAAKTGRTPADVNPSGTTPNNTNTVPTTTEEPTGGATGSDPAITGESGDPSGAVTPDG